MIDLKTRSKENYKKYSGMMVPKVRAYSDNYDNILDAIPDTFSL